MFVLAADRT